MSEFLGSSDFAESVLRQANEPLEMKSLALAKGFDLDELILAVAAQLEVDPILISSSSRQRAVAQARSIICSLAVDRLKISGAEVARKLELSSSAVSKLASRGRKDVQSSKIADHIFEFNSSKDSPVKKRPNKS